MPDTGSQGYSSITGRRPRNRGKTRALSNSSMGHMGQASGPTASGYKAEHFSSSVPIHQPLQFLHYRFKAKIKYKGDFSQKIQ